MKQSKFIKGLTLLSFAFCITTFILYRVGQYDEYLISGKSPFQTSHNGGTITTSQNDSLKIRKDSIQKLMLSSSKVLILTDKKFPFFDTVKWKKNKVDKFKSKNIEMLSSSKSAIIFKPKENFKLNLDSIKLDTTKSKIKFKQ